MLANGRPAPSGATTSSAARSNGTRPTSASASASKTDIGVATKKRKLDSGPPLTEADRIVRGKLEEKLRQKKEREAGLAAGTGSKSSSSMGAPLSSSNSRPGPAKKPGYKEMLARAAAAQSEAKEIPGTIRHKPINTKKGETKKDWQKKLEEQRKLREGGGVDRNSKSKSPGLVASGSERGPANSKAAALKKAKEKSSATASSTSQGSKRKRESPSTTPAAPRERPKYAASRYETNPRPALRKKPRSGASRYDSYEEEDEEDDFVVDDDEDDDAAVARSYSKRLVFLSFLFLLSPPPLLTWLSLSADIRMRVTTTRTRMTWRPPAPTSLKRRSARAALPSAKTRSRNRSRRRRRRGKQPSRRRLLLLREESNFKREILCGKLRAKCAMVVDVQMWF